MRRLGFAVWLVARLLHPHVAAHSRSAGVRGDDVRHVVADHRTPVMGDQVEFVEADVGEQGDHPSRQRRVGVVDVGGLLGLTIRRHVQGDDETVP